VGAAVMGTVLQEMTLRMLRPDRYMHKTRDIQTIVAFNAIYGTILAPWTPST